MKLALAVYLILMVGFCQAQSEKHLQRGTYLPKSSYEYPNNSTEGFKLDSPPIKSFKITEEGFIVNQHNLLIPSLFTAFTNTTKTATKSGVKYTWSYDSDNTVTLSVKSTGKSNTYVPVELYIKRTEPTLPEQRKANPTYYKVYL